MRKKKGKERETTTSMFMIHLALAQRWLHFELLFESWQQQRRSDILL